MKIMWRRVLALFLTMWYCLVWLTSLYYQFGGFWSQFHDREMSLSWDLWSTAWAMIWMNRICALFITWSGSVWLWYCKYSSKYSHWISHRSPMRARYGMSFVSSKSWGCLSINMLSYQCRDSHNKDKTVLRPCYLLMEIPNLKWLSLYWDVAWSFSCILHCHAVHCIVLYWRPSWIYSST